MTFTEQKFDTLHTLLLCTRISFAYQMQCQQFIWWRKILNILAYNLICMKVSNIGNDMKDDWINAGKRNKWRNVSFSCEWFLIYCCVNIMMSFRGYYQKKRVGVSNLKRLIFQILCSHEMHSSSFEFSLVVKESEIVKSFT